MAHSQHVYFIVIIDMSYVIHLIQVLVNVVGQQAARNGAMKVFETLQDGMLNKVLAYEILEIVCKVLFPELAQEYKQQ